MAVLDEGKPKSLPLTAMEQNARVKFLLSSYYLEADVCLKSDKFDLFSQTPAISVFSCVIFHFMLPKGTPGNAQDPACHCALNHFIAATAWLVCQRGLRVQLQLSILLKHSSKFHSTVLYQFFFTKA